MFAMITMGRDLLTATLLVASGWLSSGCTMVHGAGEILGLACEWVEWQPMDPASPTSPRPIGSQPDDDVCYIAWPTSGRIALASRGDEASSISCDERDESQPTADDPLVVRPGQIGWIYGTYSDMPRVTLALVTCAELDSWIDAGGTAGELASTLL